MIYQSPFTTRYGSEDMRKLWSEKFRRMLWRRVWIAVAEAQATAGLVHPDQVADLRTHADEIDIQRALEIESEIGHDLMAELKTFAEQCPQGGAILHWGLTSADVQDNADVIRQRTALALVLTRIKALLLAFIDPISKTAEMPVMGYTHLQPAEPTTLGYRLAVYAQDLLIHFEQIARLRMSLKSKGIKGAVGTAAPFVEMFKDTPLSPVDFEAQVMDTLKLEAFPVSGQTYPRVQDLRVISVISTLAASLHKFAFDLRLMHAPGFQTASEPFRESQVGSSAMPFKRNPIKSEKICSLAREIESNVSVAWHNAANSLLERTLDDSANRRSIFPETFLACDEILREAQYVVEGLVVNETGISANLDIYGPFAATERVLSALVRRGADRQKMHERLRKHSLKAWEAIREGKPNPLSKMISSDTAILQYLQPAHIQTLFDIRSYLGSAPERAKTIASKIQTYFTPESDR